MSSVWTLAFWTSPSWQLSATYAVLLAGMSAGLRLFGSSRRGLADFGREFAVVFGLLATWQFVGGYVHNEGVGARERAQQISDLQNTLGLPSELGLQHWLHAHSGLPVAANVYYAFMHLNTMGLFLLWVWLRHREWFPRVRNTVAISTGISLVVQLVAVAPPRLMPHLGFADTALIYGPSVYGPHGLGEAHQMAAMPSVHVAWAVILGGFAVAVTRHWVRWLVVAHTAITILVVSATANHWWLDGIVAAAIVGSVVLAQVAGSRLLARWARRAEPVLADRTESSATVTAMPDLPAKT